MKLRTKLLVYILSMSLLIFLAVQIYNIVKTENLVREDAARYVDATAREYANNVENELNGDMNSCRTLQQVFEDYEDLPGENPFDVFNLMIRSVLEENPQFVSVWASWELNAINPDYAREHGRIRYTYYRQNDQIYYSEEVLETDVENPTGIYYEIKSDPHEVLTEPYLFSYEQSTEQILEASVAIPMLIDGKYTGLVGADVDIERFQNIIEKISPFENSYALLVSNEGKIISHPNEELINKSINESEFSLKNGNTIIGKLDKGESFSFDMRDMHNASFYVSFAPFKVGKTRNPWYVAVVAPKSVILADARRYLLFSVLVGLAGMILLALLTWWIAKKITTPLVKTTTVLTDLSYGKTDKASEISVNTKDEIGEMANALNTLSQSLKLNAEFADEIGKGNLNKAFKPLGPEDVLGNALMKMRENLVQLQKVNDENSWIHESLVRVNDLLQGEKSAEQLGDDVLKSLAEILNIQIGSIFIEADEKYRLTASYAYNLRKANSNIFAKGEGLVGQTALEKKTLMFTDVPEDYISIKSGLGEAKPKMIILTPLVYQNDVIGIIELGTTAEFDEIKLNFLNQVKENIAIAFNSIRIRTEMKELLVKTQEQSEELRVQQEELREANEELEAQTKALKASEEDLQEQQEELKVINEELEEKTKFLEKQKSEISDKNLQLENVREDLERKAEELGIASKYKSEFLANMSHELRTPLNSLLILSKSLADNAGGNLSPDQVESAEIIYNSGNDLLKMINDILDLSKIESGKMSLNLEAVRLDSVRDNLKHNFRHLTDQKGIAFELDILENAPDKIITDQQKLEQILKNFLSNAIKFTSEGSVKLRFAKAGKDTDLSRSGLDVSKSIAISVSDTGIGIPKDKQLEIFEAFQQADGSTSRHYGGTGLGLSISRELARLLGGEIQLSSEPGQGSEFTLFLPFTANPKKQEKKKRLAAATRAAVADVQKELKINESTAPSGKKDMPEMKFIDDDRGNIQEKDAVILVVEDDPKFARILLKQCHHKKFKCIATPNGEEGLRLARKLQPNALILDIKLPGISGWQVLDLLKEDPETRHIPVHIMSGEEESIDAYKKGAIGYLTKPISTSDLNEAFGKINHFTKRKMSNLLLVEDNNNLRKSIKKLIGEQDVKIADASRGDDAIKMLEKGNFDCMVLDLGLPDMSGFELVRKLEEKQIKSPPIIVYTGKDLSREESEELQKYAETIIIKGVKSEERLLDETALFLHRVIGDMPDKQKEIIQSLHNHEEIFDNKKVLLVDDDMRNVFALTKVLAAKNMKVLRAENGKAALDTLEKNKDVDIILMDIMMPVMNGYDSIKNIRNELKMKKVPIIALTAKAMKEDRQKCIEAGANDYLTKPINIEKLFSLMKVWLYK